MAARSHHRLCLTQVLAARSDRMLEYVLPASRLCALVLLREIVQPGSVRCSEIRDHRKVLDVAGEELGVEAKYRPCDRQVR